MKTFEEYKAVIMQNHAEARTMMDVIEHALQNNIKISELVETSLEFGYGVRIIFEDMPKEVKDENNK